VEIIKNLWQAGGDALTGPGDAAIYLVNFGVFKGRSEIEAFIRSYLENIF
jgi:hypothetical protein